MKDAMPKYVPLPSTGRYMEEAGVVFGALNMPQGFDEERLEVNLAAFRAYGLVAGMDMVSVVSHSSETPHHDASINGIDPWGRATAAGAAKRQLEPLQATTITWPLKYIGFGNPRAVININQATQDAHIEDRADKRGMMDPKARAAVLNSAIKHGLLNANRQANLPRQHISQALQYYSLMPLLAASFNGVNGGLDMLEIITAAGPVLSYMGTASNFLRETLSNRETWNYIKNKRLSLFVGLNPDRYLAASGIVAARKFIRTRS